MVETLFVSQNPSECSMVQAAAYFAMLCETDKFKRPTNNPVHSRCESIEWGGARTITGENHSSMVTRSIVSSKLHW